MQILSADPYYLVYKIITDFVQRQAHFGLCVMTDFKRITAFDFKVYPVYESLRMRLQHGSP